MKRFPVDIDLNQLVIEQEYQGSDANAIASIVKDMEVEEPLDYLLSML
jgi:hypothetical protein